MYKIETTAITMPDHAREPHGDIRTGYTDTKAEAQTIARQDRKQGGHPGITRVVGRDAYGHPVTDRALIGR